MFSKSESGDAKAARPIVLKSPGGQVELGTPDSRGRYTVTVSDKRGNVELRQTVDYDRYRYANEIADQYAADGGHLRRQP